MRVEKIMRRGPINSRCLFSDGSNGLVCNPVVVGQKVTPRPASDRDFSKELAECRRLVGQLCHSHPKKHLPIRLPKMYSQEDLVQEVFYHLWTSGSFEKEYSFSGMRTCVWHTMVNIFQSVSSRTDYITRSLLDDDADISASNALLSMISTESIKSDPSLKGTVEINMQLTWVDLFNRLYINDESEKLIAKSLKVKIEKVLQWKEELLRFFKNRPDLLLSGGLI